LKRQPPRHPPSVGNLHNVVINRLIEVVVPKCSETVEESNCIFECELMVVSGLENGIAEIEETLVQESQQ